MGCRASVEAALRQVAGARRVHVDLATQAAFVVFDPGQTDVAVLRAALAEVGYRPQRATLVEAAPEP